MVNYCCTVVRFGKRVSFVVCMVIAYSKGRGQPGKVANLARVQLNKEK